MRRQPLIHTERAQGMTQNSKIVWSEGLFLRPQHMQQHERYVERFVNLRAGDLRPFAWGFSELELETDLLAVGSLAIRRARGVFPDGTPFSMPDDDPLPPALEVDVGLRDQIVYLTLPMRSGSQDRKSTRLNSSHVKISYAVFCL